MSRQTRKMQMIVLLIKSIVLSIVISNKKEKIVMMLCTNKFKYDIAIRQYHVIFCSYSR